MDGPTPEDVRRSMADFDARQEKIVAGMLTVMIKEPNQVHDREWIAERLTHIALLAGEFEAETPDAGVAAVQDYLQANAAPLLNASYLLFQRLGLDLAPQAAAGFTFEEALQRGLEYLPSAQVPPTPNTARDLGEQPLARLMAERELKPSDLVDASTEQITHKMVTRAMKGRRLTANTMDKVHRAWNRAAGSEAPRAELFDYEP